ARTCRQDCSRTRRRHRRRARAIGVCRGASETRGRRDGRQTGWPMTSPASIVPTRTDIDAAASRIFGLVSRTPFVRSDWLSDVSEGDVWLKLETVQPTGSFKLRGATNAIAVITAERPQVRRIMTASTGNHARGVAPAARQGR